MTKYLIYFSVSLIHVSVWTERGEETLHVNYMAMAMPIAPARGGGGGGVIFKFGQRFSFFGFFCFFFFGEEF